MGMLKSYLKLVLLFHKQRRFRGSVCVLGNQEIWGNFADLVACFKEMQLPYREPREIKPHTSRMFATNPALSTLSKDFVHASVFFEMLGMDEYVDVDKFDADKPTLQLDLNEPIDANMTERFDLVIDGGTAEHIFNVKGVLENMVRMTKVGGHVMHISTFQPDHGFYAFSPCLYFDYYGVNGFADPECYVLLVDYDRILQTYSGTHEYFKYEYGKTVLPPAMEKPFLIFFVARKVDAVERLAVPTQGVFVPTDPEPSSAESPGDTTFRTPPRAPEVGRGSLSRARILVSRGLQRLRKMASKSEADAALPRI